MDWIILISLFIALSAVFFWTIKGVLGIQYTFLFATGLIGLLMLWGFVRSDYSTLPSWIQAGATLMLLVITGMSTYAAIEMAKANQNLVQIAQNQASMQVKELKRDLIIEFSSKIIGAIQLILQREKEFLDSGYVITLYIIYQKEGKNKNIHYQTPSDIFKDYILVRDPILQKYLEQIFQSNRKFDDYAKNLDLLLKRVFEKEGNFIDKLNEYCNSLPNPDKSTNLEFRDYEVFALALADSKSENYTKYKFFNHYREDLISKLIDADFKQDMEEYKRIKDTFSKVETEYKKIFNNLRKEWKEEYSIPDKDMESSFKGLI